jgi:dipeptidyl aminopeptidase/acylaminoacyl peptidase
VRKNCRYHTCRTACLLGLLLFSMPSVAACASESSAAQRWFVPHPDNPAKRVEYFVQKPPGHGPWPTVVFLHGWQPPPSPGGKVFAEWGVLDKYAKRGYLAVAVSLSGFGGSTGPPDFCGPFTVDAVIGVLTNLEHKGLASPHKIVVEGISLGAVVAGLAGARDHSIAGLVLISGAYDLIQYVERPESGEAKLVVNEIKQETGGSSAALRERSVLNYARDIKAATLILNGAKDERTNPSQARRLAGVINQHGGRARVIIYPNYGHHISVKVRNEVVDPFIDSVLHGEGGAER